MRRRQFITLLGGAAVAWPLAVRAQEAGDRESTGQMPRVGWLWPGRSAGNSSEFAGFQQGLRELGYVEGKNIIVEYRFGENSMERLRDLAADLAGLKLNLILAVGTSPAKAVQQAAPTSPIVFMSGDPLGAGFVTSLSRPSGNLTGVSLMTLSEKWPELARELLPEFVAAGGLLSYGASLVGAQRQVGIYAGRILRGTNVADLPVLQLVLNLKTASAQGIEVPPMLHARTDEVIE